METKKTVHLSVGIPFQLMLISINAIILITLIIWRSGTFTAFETPPTIEHVTPAKYQEFGGSSHLVIVGLLLDEFVDFNMVTSEFIFDGTIWFKFDPGVISLDSLTKFSFLKGTIVERSEPDIQLIDNKMLVKYVIRASFSSDLNYTDFPLDSHRIYLMLINKFVAPSEVLFESSRREFNVHANVQSAGWDLIDTSVINGYIKSSLDPHDIRQDVLYPASLFVFDYSRNSVRYALSIILPLALIFYLLLLADSLRNTAAGITAILAYRFVIENLSPKTGIFMLSDYLFFMFLAASLLIFILNVIEMKKTVPVGIKRIYFTCLHVILIISVTFIILW